MKRLTIKFKILVIVTIILASGTGCEKVLNPEPYGQQTVDATFSDFNGSLSAVNGMYSQLTTGNLFRGSNALIEIDQASDDVMNDGAGSSSQYSIVDYFELVPDNAVTYNIMDNFYRVIYRANQVITRVPLISFPPAQQRNSAGTLFNDQFVGEAHFMRAYSYYNLVRILGGVPLRITEISGPKDVNLPKSSVEEVYAQIETDLKIAVEKLPPTYSGSGSGNEKGRVTKWGALMLLSEAYLTQKKYADAAAAALQVIQNPSGLKLNNTYAANFFPLNGGAKNTQESLFEIQFNALGAAANATPTTGNNFAFIMGPTTDIAAGTPCLARFRPTDNTAMDNEPGFTGGLIQEYETGDLRLDANFLQGRRGNGATGWLTKKYYEVGRGASGNGNYVAYRMADAYLVYAEAINEQSGPTTQAIDLINQLRRRAFGLALTTPSAKDIAPTQTQSSFRDIVRSERRKELALENKRWFDLVRYGYNYANQVLTINQKRTKFNQNKMLFPFPQIEIINNPELVQNPGY